MSAPTKLQWNYKDAGRDYWQITAETCSGKSDDDGNVHWEWEYKITRSAHEYGQDAVLTYTGSIVGQYDEPIQIRSILLDFLGYISSVALGFEREGK